MKFIRRFLSALTLGLLLGQGTLALAEDDDPGQVLANANGFFQPQVAAEMGQEGAAPVIQRMTADNSAETDLAEETASAYSAKAGAASTTGEESPQ